MTSDTTLTCMRCKNPVVNIIGEFKMKLDNFYGLYCGECKELINTHGGKLLKKPERRSFIKDMV